VTDSLLIHARLSDRQQVLFGWLFVMDFLGWCSSCRFHHTARWGRAGGALPRRITL